MNDTHLIMCWLICAIPSNKLSYHKSNHYYKVTSDVFTVYYLSYTVPFRLCTSHNDATNKICKDACETVSDFLNPEERKAFTMD